jgi:hypothetical protein
MTDRDLAIKFGFKEKSSMGLTYWQYPNGISTSRMPPRFHSSMDACVKWIFPYFWIIRMDLHDAIFYSWQVAHPSKPEITKGKIDESCAAAFCSAVEKFFEEERN